MQAITLTAPPHFLHVSTSMLNTRLSLCAQVMAADTDVQSGQRFRGLVLSLGFMLGIALVDGVIGALFGFGGFLVLKILAQYMSYAYALMTAMLVFLGLVLQRVIRIRRPVLRPSQRKTTNFFSALLLGIPFGLSTCPAVPRFCYRYWQRLRARVTPFWVAYCCSVLELRRAFPSLLSVQPLVRSNKHYN